MRDRILITKSDHQKLSNLIAGRLAVSTPDREYLESLESELDRAEIVAEETLPADVVAMNSRVTVKDLDTGDTKVYRLVFPTQSHAENTVSVLAPIGTAMLGYRVGDTIHWRVPRGVRRLKIVQVLSQSEVLAV